MVFVNSTNKKLEFWTTGSAFIKTYQLVLPPERQTNTWKHWKRLFLLPLPNASSFALHLLQLSKKRQKHRGLIREPCWVQGWFARCSAEMEMVVVHLFGPQKWQIHGKMEWSFLSPKHMGIITSKNEGCQGSHGFDVSLTKLSDLSPILIGCADASVQDPAGREVGRPEGLGNCYFWSAFWWMIWEGFFETTVDGSEIRRTSWGWWFITPFTRFLAPS